MPSTIPAALGAGLPVGPANVAPPAGLPDAAQAFDEVFRQLTGGLLTTSAQVGEALDGAETDPIIADTSGGAGPAGEAQPLAVVPIPPMFTLAPIATPTPPDVSGAGVDDSSSDVTAAAVDGVPSVGAGSPSFTSGAPLRVPANATPVPTAAAPAPADAATASVGSTADTEADATNDVVAAMILPAEVAGAVAPATEAEVPVRGPDRRRGIRETPARARAFDSAVAETPVETPAGIPVPAAAPAAPTTVVPNQITSEVPPATAAAVVPREMPAAAERAFALQRALARQSDNPHRDSAAPGLVAQVALAGGATTPSSGGEAGTGDAPAGKRQGHVWTGVVGPGAQVLPMTASTTAQTASLAGLSKAGAAQGEVNVPGPAARASWRAAMASSLADGVTPAAEGTRPAGAPGLVAGLPPAVELAPLRDRAPQLVDTPRATAELDAATGQSVHTQIVKSVRLQWTGGLGEARVTLKPEYLGEVTASIKVEQGVVTATLQADTPEVRRWMESHTATLRDALVEHGLKLDRLTIGEPERQSAQGDRQSRPRQKQQQQAPRPRARREASETDAPFEVTTE